MLSLAPLSLGLLTRQFLYVPYGSSAPAAGPACISCDGKVPGTKLDLTHWTNNETPEALYADTSTEICLNLARARNSGDFEDFDDALAVNNHYDSDGVLSVFACTQPEAALANAELMIHGAEAGDFGEWSSDAGVKLDCALSALASDADDEGYGEALALLPALLDEGGLWTNTSKKGSFAVPFLRKRLDCLLLEKRLDRKGSPHVYKTHTLSLGLGSRVSVSEFPSLSLRSLTPVTEGHASPITKPAATAVTRSSKELLFISRRCQGEPPPQRWRRPAGALTCRGGFRHALSVSTCVCLREHVFALCVSVVCATSPWLWLLCLRL